MIILFVLWYILFQNYWNRVEFTPCKNVFIISCSDLCMQPSVRDELSQWMYCYSYRLSYPYVSSGRTLKLLSNMPVKEVLILCLHLWWDDRFVLHDLTAPGPLCVWCVKWWICNLRDNVGVNSAASFYEVMVSVWYFRSKLYQYVFHIIEILSSWNIN